LFDIPIVPVAVRQIHAFVSVLQLNGQTSPGPLLVGVPSEASVDLEFVPIEDQPVGVIQTLAAMDYVLARGSDGPKLVFGVGNAILNCDGCVIGVGGREAFGVGEGGVDDLVGLDHCEGSDGRDGSH